MQPIKVGFGTELVSGRMTACLDRRVAIITQSGYFIVINIRKVSIVGGRPVTVALRPPRVVPGQIDPAVRGLTRQCVNFDTCY